MHTLNVFRLPNVYFIYPIGFIYWLIYCFWSIWNLFFCFSKCLCNQFLTKIVSLIHCFTEVQPSKPSSFVLRHSTCAEVTKVVKEISKKGGLHDLKCTILIIIASLTSPNRSQLFSRCMAAAMFPLNLKVSKLAPVHKKYAK